MAVFVTGSVSSAAPLLGYAKTLGPSSQYDFAAFDDCIIRFLARVSVASRNVEMLSGH
jgi:hypothetical protein